MKSFRRSHTIRVFILIGLWTSILAFAWADAICHDLANPASRAVTADIPMPGDVNESGVVNQVDAILIKDYLLKINEISGKDALANADANQDGVVDVADMIWIAENPTPPELAPDVFVIDSIDDLTALDWTSPTLILQWTGSGDYGIEAGDILVGTDFNGFLRRVESISENGSILTFETTQAALADVILHGQSSGKRVRLGPPVLASEKVRVAGKSTKCADWDRVEWNLSGEVLYRDENVTIDLPTAVLAFEPMVEIDWTIEGAELKYFRAEAGGDLIIDLAARINAQINTEWNKEIPIPGTKYQQIYIQWTPTIPPIPIVEVVTFELVAKAHLEGDVFATIEPGFKYTLPVRVGAEYAAWNDSWREIRDPIPNDPECSLDWQAGGDVKARVTIAPTVSVELYAIAGPNFSIEPYLAFDGNVRLNPPECNYQLDAGVDAVLGFYLGILDATFIDHEFPPWNLYNKTLLSGECTPPAEGVIEIDVTPDDGSWTLSGPAGLSTVTGTGDRMGASALTEAPDGYYTISCDDNLTGYKAPPPIARILASGATLRFEPVYSLVRQTGTIEIDIFPNAGSWTLEGPVGFNTINGTGDRKSATAIRNAPLGEYSLIGHDNVPEYIPPSPQAKTLVGGGNLLFTAVWKPEGSGPDEITINLPGGVPLVMVRIPAGSFQMGSPEDERSRDSHEGPVHTVNIGYDFYMGKYELTQAQWLAVMGSWPDATYYPGCPYSFGVGDNHPAYFIPWNDVKNFIKALNNHIASTGQGSAAMRLPSEAEWEYACRAGTQTRFYFGNSLSVNDSCEDDGIRSQYMWYCGNYDPYGWSKPVGGKLPNAFGLYDMSGNVWEWCEDDWHGSYNDAPADGSAWVDNPRASGRVIRGGCSNHYAWYSRSAFRGYVRPSYLGDFVCCRVVLRSPGR